MTSTAERPLCFKKRMYTTPGEAMNMLRSRRRHERKPIWAYKCQGCVGYHLTSVRPPLKDNLEKP